MYVMNSTVQMLFRNVARANYPSALTFSASAHPISFNAGIALTRTLVRMTVHRSDEIAVEAARAAAAAREPG